MSLDLGISSVVFESASADEMAPDVVARHCRVLGLRAVELRPDYLRAGRSPAGVAEILGAAGVRVIYATDSVLAAESPDPHSHSPLRRDLAIARELGARMLRIFPGDLTGLGPAAATFARTWGRAASDAGVQLLLENVGDGPGSDLPALAGFVRGMPGLRLNVDVGNAAQAGFDVPAAVAHVRDMIAMVHLKGLSLGTCTDAGAIDFTGVARALSGWDGPACFEQDAGPTPWVTVAAWVQRMTSAGFAAGGTGA